MYDKDLFERIINCEVSEKELIDFFPQNEREYDLNNSFDKYFSLDKIKHAIELYNSNQISDKYLSHWACAYYWIFMASNWNSEDDITLKYNIEEEIADWFDAVSFFDDSMLTEVDPNYLIKFYDAMQILCDIRQNIIDWTAYYKTDESYLELGDEAVILCVNEKNKFFVIINGFLDNKIRQSNTYLSDDEFSKKVQALKDMKYKELMPYEYEEEDKE